VLYPNQSELSFYMFFIILIYLFLILSATHDLDFYSYACGGWMDDTVLAPGEEIRTFSFDTISDNIG
jgi:hypothetical protein